MFKLDLEKAEEPEIKLPTPTRSQKKQENSRKTSTYASLTKDFDDMDHKKLWKILREMGIPDHLICLLRNLPAGQEATVRTGHGTMDWFQIGKRVRQGCILSPCLFMYRVHHAKCWVGWNTSWNQDCWEKYQQPQICRYHSNGRKQRASWWRRKRRVKKLVKNQHSKN